jgi:Na+(H+)/acetate symporter ActP
VIAAKQGALISGVVAAAFSWASMAQTPWEVHAIWYASLTLSLTAVATATQQAVALSRIICHSHGDEHLRWILARSTPEANGDVKPSGLQLYIWQIPLSMLNASIYLFLTGLLGFLIGAIVESEGVKPGDRVKVRQGCTADEKQTSFG